jgi:predicted Zn-dependent peptidase
MGACRSLALLVMISVALCASRGRAAVLDPSRVQSATLSNGLRLVVCEDEAASVVSVEVVIKVGSAHEGPAQAGLAHLLEHVCWVGTPGADPRQQIEDVGGVTDAGTLRDFTRFYATVEASDFGLAVRGLGAMVLRDQFDEGVVFRERGLILEEAAMRLDRPRAALNDLAFEALYGSTHPYGRHIEGTAQSLSNLSSADLAAFHRDWYLPNNMAVIVAGKVDFYSARQVVETVFGRLVPAALPPRSEPVVDRPAKGGERVVETSLPEAYVMAAFVGPAIYERPPSPGDASAPGRGAQSPYLPVCATDLLATLLAHPQVGRLDKELRSELGLAREVGVDFLTQRDRGLFGVWAVCDPANVPAVKEAIRAQLARLAAEPVPADELAAAKRMLTAQYAFANETPAGRVSTLGFYEAIDSYRTATQYLSRIQAVTASQLMVTAAWYAGEPVWVVLMPGRGAMRAGPDSSPSPGAGTGGKGGS